jgi:hypothetical protein
MYPSFLSVQSAGARRAILGTAALALVLGATMPANARQPQAAASKRDRNVVEFTVDVAENLTAKFVPTFVKPTDVQPERGSFFVSEGRLYPGGLIQGDGADFDPTRPGHIGVWIVRGTHLVAASEIPAATWWADTAQLFVLGRQGIDQIATEGLEGSRILTRIVTGGTGNYAGFIGEQRQQFLGFNATGGANLRVTFVLRKVVR